MADQLAKKLMKYFIIIINTIVFFGGLCLAGVAGYTALNKNSLLHQLSVDLQITLAMTGLYILLAIGLVMAMLALMGCIGAARESRLVLGIYFFFLLVMLVLEITAIILCFTKLKTAEEKVSKAMKPSNPESNTNEAKLEQSLTLLFIEGILPKIEAEKRCCGLHGASDYGMSMLIPNSCYSPVSRLSIIKQARLTQDAAPSSNDELRDDSAAEQKNPVPTVNPNSDMSSVTSSPPSQNRVTSTTATATTTPSPLPTTTTTEKVPTRNTTTPRASRKVATTSVHVNPTTVTTTTLRPGNRIRYRGVLYNRGCLSILNPAIYAAGGIAIGILLLELLLLIFTGLLLAGMHGGYASLA